MSANADSVGFKLASNVHVWAYFGKIASFWKKLKFYKKAYGLGQDISVIRFLVGSDLEALFK